MNEVQEIRQDQEIITIQSKTKEVVDKAHALIVKDEGTQKLGTDILSFIKKAYRNLEMKRKLFTQPILDAKKNIDDEFKLITIPLKEAEQAIKDKLLAYHKEIQEKAEEERKKKQIETDKTAEKLGLEKVEVKTEGVSNQTRGAVGTSHIVKRWAYEVVKKEEVPEDYKVIDNVKINNAIRMGTREIPGLRIFQKDSIGGR